MDKPLWGLRVLKFDGAIAPRVLKFDSGYAAEGCGGASKFIEGASLYKTFTTALRARELPLWWLAPPPCPVGSMSYDTESKPRNVLASPLGEEGHEVAKGWTVVRMIMIFLFYVLSP